MPTVFHKLNLTTSLAERNCYTKMKCLFYGSLARTEFFFSECMKRKTLINCSEFGGG